MYKPCKELDRKTTNYTESMMQRNALVSYFALERKYYKFLKEKLGENFRGSSDHADGQLQTYGEWRHLAAFENRLKLREIILECIAGNKVIARGRMGDKYITGEIDFPYLVESRGGEYEFSWAIWQFNEIISVMTAESPVTAEQAAEYSAMIAEQEAEERALAALPDNSDFDSEW